MSTKYQTILADLPWQYKRKNVGGSGKSGAGCHYPVMSINEICSMRDFINELAEKNCLLFLWTTSPKLNEVFTVVEAWGFEYKTSLIWVKTRGLGMGFWFRVQYEMCLICTRGKVKPFYMPNPNLFFAPRTKHSRKPEKFFQLIDSIIPRPAIELFAREKRDGWDAWGDEI